MFPPRTGKLLTNKEKKLIMGTPLIPIAAGLISQGIGAFAQGKMNAKTRRWNEHMYRVQRQDSLADWAMQNEYNSPTAQMERLRAANLNPHLVYGNGAVAGGTSQSPRSSSVPSWSPRAPEIDLTSGLTSFMDMEVKQAQIDNLRSGTTVKDQDAVLRAAQVVKTLTETDKGKVDIATKNFDLEMKNTLKQISIDAAKANLNKTLADTRFTLDENERKAAMQEPNLVMAAEKILTMRLDRAHTSWQIGEIKGRIENLKKDATLKQLDIDLKEKGIQPGDAMWSRVLARILEGSGSIGIPTKMWNDTQRQNDSLRTEMNRKFKVGRY